jgi:SAM-dependent methyltransferase
MVNLSCGYPRPAEPRMPRPIQPDQPSDAAGRAFGVTEILAEAGAPATALDLGCGSGRVTVEFALAGTRATGIDT